jgi:hypothetical protein
VESVPHVFRIKLPGLGDIGTGQLGMLYLYLQLKQETLPTKM